MPLPTVAILGRPNVGKSSLFNRLIGKPVAIVDPTAGVTRDRIFHPVRRDRAHFDLIDTGGIGIVDAAKLEMDVNKQIERAVNLADHILFMVDVRDGITDLDKTIASRLREHKDRITVVANKVDHDALEGDIYEFERLGLGPALPVSAEQVRGFLDLWTTWPNNCQRSSLAMKASPWHTKAIASPSALLGDGMSANPAHQCQSSAKNGLSSPTTPAPPAMPWISPLTTRMIPTG